MRALAKVNGNGEQRARVSDELRQLKQMSKGLRTQAIRSLLERHASQRLERQRLERQRLERKSAVVPEKARPAAAA